MNNQSKSKSLVAKIITIILLILLFILWLSAPFMSVNLASTGSGQQPSSIQILSNSVEIIGDISQTPAFLASIVVLIIFILSFIFTILNKFVIVAIASIVGFFILLVTKIQEYSLLDGYDCIGAGAIIIILIFVANFIISLISTIKAKK